MARNVSSVDVPNSNIKINYTPMLKWHVVIVDRRTYTKKTHVVPKDWIASPEDADYFGSIANIVG